MSAAAATARLVAAIEQRLLDQVRAAIRETAYAVIDATPCRSGRLKNSWRAGLNERPAHTDVGWRRGRWPQDGSLSKASVDAALAALKLGDQFVLANDVWYLHDLDRGGAAQAPHGILRLATIGLGG